MRLLVTGNLGYIGSVLASNLKYKNEYEVFGIDSGLYENCAVDEFQPIQTTQKDIRDISHSDLQGMEVVIHLAAISNDPLGAINEKVTFEINELASVKLFEIAKSVGVKHLIYFSTQSVYGVSELDQELDEYSSKKNPQTAYAISKWNAEKKLLEMQSTEFAVTILRPATVFGWSPFFRSDIVFNNLLLNGYFKKSINLSSDGSPWRPVVHIQDVCNVVNKILENRQTANNKIYNVGKFQSNYRVIEIAQIAAQLLNIPKINLGKDDKDQRTYRVSFNRLNSELGLKLTRNLFDEGKNILNKISDYEYQEISEKTVRLKNLQKLKDQGLLDKDLRFIR